MAWVTFPTLTDGQVLTGAHMQIVRDNFAECPTAKVTASGQIVAATGATAMEARLPSVVSIATFGSTTSTSYTDLAGDPGPSTTVTTGQRALVCIHSRMTNSTGGQTSYVGVDLSGATTTAASDLTAAGYESSNANDNIYSGGTWIFGLTAGSNTFKMQYRCTGGTSSFDSRRLSIVPF